MLIDPVRGRRWKYVSSRARYPHFLLSDQRSAITRPRKSRNPEKPILDFACCIKANVSFDRNRRINSWQSLTTVFINKARQSSTNQSGYCLFVEGKVAGSYWGTSSDDRLKHNEKDITNGLEIIRQLKPQVYQKKQKK